MTELIGEFECKLDPKGRVALPAGLLKQLSDEQKSSFILGRGIEKHLVLYPYTEWQKIASQVKILNDFVPKERRFAQRFFAGHTPLTLDGQNRLLIPKRMLIYAQIEDSLVMSARPQEFGDRIELWEPERYDAELLDEATDFSQLAQEVMGKKLVIPLDQE